MIEDVFATFKLVLTFKCYVDNICQKGMFQLSYDIDILKKVDILRYRYFCIVISDVTSQDVTSQEAQATLKAGAHADVVFVTYKWRGGTRGIVGISPHISHMARSIKRSSLNHRSQHHSPIC